MALPFLPASRLAVALATSLALAGCSSHSTASKSGPDMPGSPAAPPAFHRPEKESSVSLHEVEPIPADELDGTEGWRRRTPEPDIRGVEAIRGSERSSPDWLVSVSMMEFVRGDPFEREVRTAMAEALRGVAGVRNVFEEDRETWRVQGRPSGKVLVEAATGVVERFADRAK